MLKKISPEISLGRFAEMALGKICSGRTEKFLKKFLAAKLETQSRDERRWSGESSFARRRFAAL
jgi:hypothetical protein